MATVSGTVGATVVDVTTFIEHAARRCGVLATSLSAEQQLSARENLFFLLSDLANRGISLWCVQKTVLGLNLNQTTYQLPVGTLDVLNVEYRTASFYASPVIAGTSAVSNTGSSLSAVTTVGLVASLSNVATLAIETSADGVTWVPLSTVTLTLIAGQTYWVDLDNTTAAAYWRLRETVLASLPASAVYFGYGTRETSITALNRDDYVNLPNKASTGRPLQYWYDRQVTIPKLWVWPVPNDPTAQLVVWNHRQIQDVGTYINLVEVPQRWFESVIFLLAMRICLELPAASVPPDRYGLLKQEAMEHLTQAENGETDGAPIKVIANISGYTR